MSRPIQKQGQQLFCYSETTQRSQPMVLSGQGTVIQTLSQDRVTGRMAVTAVLGGRGGSSAAQYFSISRKISSFSGTTHTPSVHCIDLCPGGAGKQTLERSLALIFLCGPLSSAPLLPVNARTFMHQRSSLKHSEVSVVDGASETHTILNRNRNIKG